MGGNGWGGYWGGMGGKDATGGFKKVVPSLRHSEFESSVSERRSRT